MATEPPPSSSCILGITGPIAAGKSFVGDVLLGLGALARIDADALVHALMLPGTAITRAVVSAFGERIVAADGSVDRKALGEIVFNDSAALQQLEDIVHPAVEDEARRIIRSYEGVPGVVVLDAVKLLQGQLADACGAIWVVQCRRDEQQRRLTEDRGMSLETARARLAAGPSFEDPRVSAIIDNSGSRADTRMRVERLWATLS